MYLLKYSWGNVLADCTTNAKGRYTDTTSGHTDTASEQTKYYEWTDEYYVLLFNRRSLPVDKRVLRMDI